MTRATISYCVTCGKRVSGTDIVAHRDEDYCLACSRVAVVGASGAPSSAAASLHPGSDTTRGRRAGQSTRSLHRPARGLSPQATLMASAALLGLVAGSLGYLALGASPRPAETPPAAVRAAAVPGGLPDPPPQPIVPPRPIPPVPPDDELAPVVPTDVGSGSRSPAPPAPAVGSARLIGNRRSMRLHRADCEQGEKISEHNRDAYDAADEAAALAKGYRWCSVCGPHAGSGSR